MVKIFMKRNWKSFRKALVKIFMIVVPGEAKSIAEKIDKKKMYSLKDTRQRIQNTTREMGRHIGKGRHWESNKVSNIEMVWTYT